MRYFLMSSEEARRATYKVWELQVEEDKPLTKFRMVGTGGECEVSTPEPAGELLLLQVLRTLDIQFKQNASQQIRPMFGL